jgi:myosin heavy subunit
LKTRHKDHERLIDEKLHMKTEFGIRHFAGPVIYDASEFVERNFDKLPDALLQLATQSSNPLLAREFRELVSQQQDEDAHETARKSKMTTVMERFRFQLRVLMDELSDTQVRYIRCIKPNDTLVPKVFDHVTVLRQLKCAGLITAIEITRETFPNKLPFKAVEDRFKCLLGPKKLAMMNSMEQDDKCQFMMSALFAPEIEKFNTSRFTMPYTCGKTKVFYRAGSLEFLETLRQTYLTAKAEQLQRWARMTVAVRSYRKTSRALGVIQGWGRIIGAKAELKRRRRAVVTIQSLARCWLQKAHYKQKLAHAKRLVAAGRRLLVRIRIQRRRSLANLKERSATKLSAWIRSRRALRQYRQTVRCTRMLQSSFRAKKAVECLLIRKGAALCIEDWYGRAKARQSSYGDEKAAAIRQASAVSCEIQVHPEEGAHMSPDDAATMVQSAARTKGDIRKGAATIMQTWIRGRTKRTNYIGLKRSILCLQDRYMLKKALGHEFTAHALHGVPKVVEYVNESVDDLNTISNESDAIASKEQVQFVNKSENLIEERLTKELNEEKLKVLSLERDIAMMSSEAELHAQDMEADFDERLVGYEEEVLILKQTIAQLEDGRVKAEKEMAATDEAHKKSIQRLQFEIQKIQSSHRDYLGKIMELLDDTEAAQNLQTSRIREEMEVVKRERDKQVSSLKEEIKLLRSIGFGSKKKGISLSEKAQRLSRKLYAELSADNVLLVVKEAQQQPHSPPQPYIEVNLSSKVRNMISYLEEIVSMAEYEVADLHARSDTLQQHLVYAYEEVEYARGGRQAY